MNFWDGLISGIVLASMLWALVICPAGEREGLRELQIEIDKCYTAGQRAVMLSDGTVECRGDEQWK